VGTNPAARRISLKEPNKMRVGIYIPNLKGNILFKEASAKSGASGGGRYFPPYPSKGMLQESLLKIKNKIKL